MNNAELLKEEYIALRAEICQSIAKQHQILLGGYGLTSAAIGYIFGSASTDWKRLVMIPLILLAMVALWTVECNRMVRASYYIGYVLWPELCKDVDRKTNEGWETWIRIRRGNEGGFRKRQDCLQQVVVVLLPFCLSVASVVVVLVYVWNDAAWSWVTSVFGLFLLSVWAVVYGAIRKISNLAAVVPSPKPITEVANKQ